MDRIPQTGISDGAALHRKAIYSAASLPSATGTDQVGDSYETGAGTVGSPVTPAKMQTTEKIRPIWQELQKLGIWSSMSATSAICTPLAATLSTAAADDLKALLREMEQKGFSFSFISDPNKPRQYGSTQSTGDNLGESLLTYTPLDNILGRLAVTLKDPSKPEKPADTLDTLFNRGPEPVIKEAKVHTFKELKDLESIVMKGDFSKLDKPELANELKELEDCGMEFRILEEEGRSGYSVSEAVKGNRSRPVGLYGAYRALAGDEKDTGSLWVKAPGGGLYPLQGPEDIETVEFFAMGKSVPRLDTSPLARRLRDLGSVGITFHRGKDYDQEGPLAAYYDLSELGYYNMSMSIDGVAKEDHEIHKGNVPTPSKRLLELADFYSREIVPKVKQGEISAKEGNFYLQGLARTGPQQTMTEGFQTIQQMRSFEQGLNSDLDSENLTRAGIISFNSVMRAMGEGSDRGEVINEYKTLRKRDIQPGVASDAIVHFRGTLKPRCFDEQDFNDERERLLEIAPSASSFSDVPKARQALQIEVPEPYTERLKALQILVDSQEGRQRKWDGPTAMQDAIQDYLSLLPWPRQSLSQAAGLLGRLHQVMADKIGMQQSRDTYSYLQRGIQRGAFDEGVVETFSKEFELAQDMDFALRMLKPEPSITETYAERAEAAKILRKGIKDLTPRSIKSEQTDDFLSSSSNNVDEAAEDYRFMLGLPDRSLKNDALTFTSLHRNLDKCADWEVRRGIFKEYKQGGFVDAKGQDFIERLNGELALSEDLDVTLRAMRGEYTEPFQQRKELLESLKSGLADLKGTEEEKKPSEDYRLLLSQHCSQYSLSSEADTLMTVHKALVPGEGWQGSRNAFTRLMKSLREGPWSGMPLKEATQKFLSTYLVAPDLDSALGSLEMPPTDPGSIDGFKQEDDCVIIGGVKLKVKS